MSVTDQAALSDVQFRVLETANSGASLDTDLWTIAEIIGYMNDRQRRFIAATKLAVSIATQATVIGTATYSTNNFGGAGASLDLVDIYRLAWLDAASASNELQPSDSWIFDNAVTAWPTATGTPSAYALVTEPTVTLRVMLAPAAAGSLHCIYTYLGTALSNNGTTFVVSDEFVPFIVWGTLADMLAKEGQAHNPSRAAYCESRFNEGIELALLMAEESSYA